MSSLLPIALYGLKVPAGDVMVPASTNFPATFRITMAAIDPSAPPEHTGTTNGDSPARATLKIIYDPSGPLQGDESEEGSDDENYLKALLEEDESSSDEQEKNGGPSDPSKTKKARKQAAAKQMMKSLQDTLSDDGMDVDGDSGANGVVSKVDKGKGKATSEDEESDEDDLDGMDGMNEIILCTLDPAKNWQQPLDITVGEDEQAFFKVSGTHTIYLTGNYVGSGLSQNHEIYDADEDNDYDLSPDEDELEDDDDSDKLDDLEDPRITELASDDEEAPKLTKKEQPTKKGKNKRAADDSDVEPANLDEIMAKALKPAEPVTNGEPKLSKKQLKKLKNNAGKAVEAAVENKGIKKVDAPIKDSPNGKADKKVQFAKNLEQGPSGAAKEEKSAKEEPKANAKKEGDPPKASLGPKTLQGVLIDDRKLGKGPAAKKGQKVSMRYIGKLEDGKVFDANKSGSPYTFTIGTGEVIKGWDIGVAGMSAGGERRITVPPQLAYGSKALPGIPANSKLIFDVKLLAIK